MQIMNTRRCLKIARRINALLTQELGHGVDARRMLAEPLYARDVLLVCDAHREHELATLSPRFRRAILADDEGDSPAPRRSGFSAPRFLSSLFGNSSTLEATAGMPPPQPRRGWFGRSRSAVK